MSMFENFPYTNLHELNLQWLIEEVKKCYSPDNPPEAMVISVNGESGIVTLYKDAHIAFPDIDAIQWNMYRGSDGKITGIQFTKDAPAERINDNQRFVIYDAGNPPPYPVVSVNGETGAITLYSEAYVEFPNLDGDNWGIQRKLNADTENETMIGIMLDDDGNLSVTKDEETIPVFTEDNPPPYPVRSVDGMTGNIHTWGYNTASKINIPLPAPGDDWSIGRVIDQGGNLSIKIMYDDNIQKCTAYMVYDDGVNTPTPVKLLTLEDIPSSAGVVSFNGLTGVVVVTGADIKTNPNTTNSIDDDITSILTSINTLGTDINSVNNVINNITYIINEDKADPPANIPANSYVYVKNSAINGISDGFYKTVNAVSSNVSFTSADLNNTGFEIGIINVLANLINTKQNILSDIDLSNTVSDIVSGLSLSEGFLYKYGNVCSLSVVLTAGNSQVSIPAYSEIVKFNRVVKPIQNINVFAIINNTGAERVYVAKYVTNDKCYVSCNHNITVPANGTMCISATWISA